MAAPPTLHFFFSLFAASDSSPSNFLSRLACRVLHIIRNRNQHLHLALSLLLLFTFTLSFLVFSLYSKLAKKREKCRFIAEVPVRREEGDVDKVPELEEIEDERVSDPTGISHSFLLEILPSSSPKWGKFSDGEGGEAEKNVSGSVARREAVKEKRKKKKRARKKRPDSNGEEEGVGIVKEKEELVCLYPFTTSSSATQRRIKQHYDELVRCHGSKASSSLKLAQVLFFNSMPFVFLLPCESCYISRVFDYSLWIVLFVKFLLYNQTSSSEALFTFQDEILITHIVMNWVRKWNMWIWKQLFKNVTKAGLLMIMSCIFVVKAYWLPI